MRGSAALALLLVGLCSQPASAHSPTVAVLRVEQHSQTTFTTSWTRLQGVSDPATAYLVLRPRFPDGCTLTPPALRCPRGLSGSLGFAGLGEANMSSGVIQLAWLEGAAQSFTFTAIDPLTRVHPPTATSAGTWPRRASTFTWIGMEHIWLGFDHLLFVLGLLWLVRSRRMLVATVSAFTAGHSLTLGAATLGLTSVPIAPAEAVIALSLAFVAAEALRARAGAAPTAWSKAPWTVALGFGLLHGFGFASALSEYLLPNESLVVPLLCFNLGVELGQLAFVIAVLGAAALARKALGPAPLTRARPWLQYAAGSVAMFWFFERLRPF